MSNFSLFPLVLVCLNLSVSVAQDTRFHHEYPLAVPSSQKSELSYEMQRTVSAMLGGVKIASDATTPSKTDDKEAFTKESIKLSLQTMLDYFAELSSQVGIDNAGQLKKIEKSIKAGKFDLCNQQLQSLGAQFEGDIEAQFFVWKEYLSDIQQEVPWLSPQNIEVTRVYRQVLSYVSKVYERPFGVQAEQGAVIADAAQALSNCLEHPESIAWKGEKRIKMKEDDELRRLASNVAYYNWRMHDRISGRRAALINTDMIRHLQNSLYQVVYTIIKEEEQWIHHAQHGKNLRQLCKDAAVSGWYVNGDRAQKKPMD
jgi:hypothetical protein